MRRSPRRPLILKSRKLPFPKSETEVPRDKPRSAQCKSGAVASGEADFPDSVLIVDCPSIPDTPEVVLKTADLQSVTNSLSAEGMAHSPEGLSKLILFSTENGGMEAQPSLLCSSSQTEGGPGRAFGNPLILDLEPDGETAQWISNSENTAPLLNKDQGYSSLNDSLTNIQWLGGMFSDGLKPDTERRASKKENWEPCTQRLQFSQNLGRAQRPPYSYMAMIQFAINSKPDRRMVLKEIYAWIVDHFPYFRDVAKPGWKNSVRHNLSLHDMFTRGASPDGKISFWTIRPEANRCLTLDQVYKPTWKVDSSTSRYTQNLKPAVPLAKKRNVTVSSGRRMKQILPHSDSHLTPVQLSLSPSLFLPSAQLPLGTNQQKCSSSTANILRKSQNAYSAPKCVPASVVAFPEASYTGSEGSVTRRKQRLAPAATAEPILLLPSATFFDWGVTSDLSTGQDLGTAYPVTLHAFKTPIKGSRPISSTPSKLLSAGASLLTPTVPWRTSPEGPDFSPVRGPQGPPLTPLQHQSHAPSHLSTTPFGEPPLFNSPSELLASSSSRQAGGATPPNRSPVEGPVQDAVVNDSPSKILVDISFSELEDEELDVCGLSWSNIIPELK